MSSLAARAVLLSELDGTTSGGVTLGRFIEITLVRSIDELVSAP